MAFVSSGALIVLSEVGDHYFPPAASVITKVVPESSGGFGGTATVTVIGCFPGGRPYTQHRLPRSGGLRRGLPWTQPRSGCSPMRLMCGGIRRARTAASASV